MGWSVVSFVFCIAHHKSFIRFVSSATWRLIICAIFLFFLFPCHRLSVCRHLSSCERRHVKPPNKTATNQKKANAFVCRTDLPYNVHVVRSTEYLVEVRIYRYNTALAALIIHHSLLSFKKRNSLVVRFATHSGISSGAHTTNYKKKKKKKERSIFTYFFFHKHNI